MQTRTYFGEAANYAVYNVLSPRDLVFTPGLSDINWTITVPINETEVDIIVGIVLWVLYNIQYPSRMNFYITP